MHHIIQHHSNPLIFAVIQSKKQNDCKKQKNLVYETTAKTKSQPKSKTTRTIKEEPAKEIQVEKPTDSEKPKTKQTKTATKTKAETEAETKANKTTTKKSAPTSKTTKTSAGKKEKSTDK